MKIKPGIEGPGGCPVCLFRKDQLYNEDLLDHLKSYHPSDDLAEYIFDLCTNVEEDKENLR
jgi:hypothetical protein